MRLLLSPLLALALLLPTPAAAQFGILEGFADRVSDLSFYFSGGWLAGPSTALSRDSGTIRGFGLELLFDLAYVTRPDPSRTADAPTDSVRRVWTGMEVVRSEEGVDTLLTYEVERLDPPDPPADTLWELELGLGYGQLAGYELAEPTLDMSVSVRELPSATLYASYEPWGNYFGVRSGFMQTRALQVADEEGTIVPGEADAFLVGALAGYAFNVEQLWLFVEGAYTVRHFPSVEWDAGGGLPPTLPRELNMSGWSLSTGVQFPFR
jgi:hypothetical protein